GSIGVPMLEANTSPCSRHPSPSARRWAFCRLRCSRMPYPENIGHHFVGDPTKFDFYVMDCYRQLAEDKMAGHLAGEVLRASTDFDGAERAPMRNNEARITWGVIAAREGDIDQAVHYGERALTESRRSLPSLPMVSRDLARVLKERYPAEQATENYLDQLRTVVGNLARNRHP